MPKKVKSIDDERITIGIDPGWSGGIACITDSTDRERLCWSTHAICDEEQLWKYLSCTGKFPNVHAYIEEVHAMPSQGVTSMFKFGGIYYALRMALIAAGVPFTTVRPQTWLKEFGLKRQKNERQEDFKRRIRTHAQQEFNTEFTLNVCDAILIAEYGRRKKL